MTEAEASTLDALAAACDVAAKAQRSPLLTVLTDVLSSLSRGLYGRAARCMREIEDDHGGVT